MLLENVDNALTEKVIGAFYKVYNTLGFGYLEKVYENALIIELRKSGLKVEPQKPIKVYYEGVVVGEYFADLFIENKLIVEIKSVSHLTVEHESQIFNYLKSTNTAMGLLMNFGPKAEVKRKIWTL
jgi:GxxExxY protein